MGFINQLRLGGHYPDLSDFGRMISVKRRQCCRRPNPRHVTCSDKFRAESFIRLLEHLPPSIFR